MSLTLLLDLDHTLLDTNLDAFMPAYFQALSQHMENHVESTAMLRALIAGLHRMNESEDPTQVGFSPLFPVIGRAFHPVFKLSLSLSYLVLRV